MCPVNHELPDHVQKAVVIIQKIVSIFPAKHLIHAKEMLQENRIEEEQYLTYKIRVSL